MHMGNLNVYVQMCMSIVQITLAINSKLDFLFTNWSASAESEKRCLFTVKSVSNSKSQLTLFLLIKSVDYHWMWYLWMFFFVCSTLTSNAFSLANFVVYRSSFFHCFSLCSFLHGNAINTINIHCLCWTIFVEKNHSHKNKKY